jgi:hypothetical protein
MNKEERAKFKELQKQNVTIYRGMTTHEQQSGCFGVSWTLSKKVAEFFLTYYRNQSTRDMPKVIHSITVPGTALLAYFSEREEEEVIYLSKPLIKAS